MNSLRETLTAQEDHEREVSALEEVIRGYERDMNGVESDYAHILRFVVSKGLGREYDLWEED